VGFTNRLLEFCPGSHLIMTDEFYQWAETQQNLRAPSEEISAAEVRLKGSEPPRNVWRFRVA
jgi:hypothetical protein